MMPYKCSPTGWMKPRDVEEPLDLQDATPLDIVLQFQPPAQDHGDRTS